MLSNMDNLTHHLKELDSDILMSEGTEEHEDNMIKKQQVKISNSKRRLTNAEKNELQSAVLLKRKATLKKELEMPDFKDFKILMVLGRGAFGKVFLGELRQNK